MKTAEIKDILKKDLLIVELPEGSYPEATSRLLAINNPDGSIKIFKGSFCLLGSFDEIKEEYLLDLVETFNNGAFRDYKELFFAPDMETDKIYLTASESFNSAIETVVLWENPYAEPDKFIDGFDNPCYEWWNEAESRTFDRNRTLIFIKN